MSDFSWINYDSEAYERFTRIIALFSERESRDELGLGGIRNSLSDIMFPGTSTLHTRLRYMLIVPWTYLHIEGQNVSSENFHKEVETLERSLIEPLKESSGEDEWGIIGSSIGSGVRILPSTMYWNGLESWGIRNFSGSRYKYASEADSLYTHRRALAKQKSKNRNENDIDWSETTRWHPNLPSCPEGFPENLEIDMKADECGFIQDCIKNKHSDSLLAHLALHCEKTSVSYPWLHPELAGFRKEQRIVLEHARLFSQILNGASLLYNLQLAELAEQHDLAEEHRNSFTFWEKEMMQERYDVQYWQRNLTDFWRIVLGRGHHISPATMEFVERWSGIVASSMGLLVDNERCRLLIKSREKQNKKSKSRFVNKRALDQWGGHSGTNKLNYRWNNVQGILSDLYEGLAQ